MDRFDAFLQEIYTVDPGHTILGQTVYEDFKVWIIGKYGPMAWGHYNKRQIFRAFSSCPYPYRRYHIGRCLTGLNYRIDDVSGVSSRPVAGVVKPQIRLAYIKHPISAPAQSEASSAILMGPQTLPARTNDTPNVGITFTHPHPNAPPVQPEPAPQFHTPPVQTEPEPAPQLHPPPVQPVPTHSPSAPPPLRHPAIKSTLNNSPGSVPRRANRRLHPPPPLPARPTGPVIYMAGQTELPDLDRFVRPFLYNADGTLKSPPPSSKTPADVTI
jgi:hypothetical protein